MKRYINPQPEPRSEQPHMKLLRLQRKTSAQAAAEGLIILRIHLMIHFIRLIHLLIHL